jgi:hypothetical protein
MKNAVFWDVTRGSFKDQCFGGMYRLHRFGEKNQRAGENVSTNYQVKHAVKKY